MRAGAQPVVRHPGGGGLRRARLFEPGQPSRQAFLGVAVAKGDRLTDWRRRPLTDSQVAYAAADVENLLDLADAIGAQLDEDGRHAWAEEECAAVLARGARAGRPGPGLVEAPRRPPAAGGVAWRGPGSGGLA